jgi:LTXXQ motif family protein
MARWLNVSALVLLIALLSSASSFAEEQKSSAESLILIPGALSRIDSYGPMGSWRLCSPQSMGLTEWRSSFLEHLLRPNKSQMEMLGRLQTASAAAKQIIASSCAKETVSTGPIHFSEMQKRLAGLLESIKVLREPYEAFYASLDSRQKALLDGLGPTRRGWAWGTIQH